MILKRKISDANKNEDGLIFFPEECETIAVNAVSIKNGQVSELAVHDDEEEVYLITKGKGIVEIDGVTHEAEVGDVLYIPRNATHFVRGTSEEEFEYVCVAVWPDTIPEKNK